MIILYQDLAWLDIKHLEHLLVTTICIRIKQNKNQIITFSWFNIYNSRKNCQDLKYIIPTSFLPSSAISYSTAWLIFNEIVWDLQKSSIFKIFKVMSYTPIVLPWFFPFVFFELINVSSCSSSWFSSTQCWSFNVFLFCSFRCLF